MIANSSCTHAWLHPNALDATTRDHARPRAAARLNETGVACEAERVRPAELPRITIELTRHDGYCVN